MVAADGGGVFLAYITAYQLRALEPKPLLEYSSFSSFSLLAVALIPVSILTFAACGLYSTRQSYSRLSEVGRVMVAVSLGVMMLIVVDYLNLGVPLFPGRKVPFYALGLGVLLVLTTRQLVRWAMQVGYARGRGLHNIIVVGTGVLAARLVDDLVKRGRGNNVVAVVSATDAGALFRGQVPVYATIDQALDAHRVVIDELVHADPAMDRDGAAQLMQLANTRGMGYRFVPDLYGVYAAGSTLTTVSGVPVMEVRLTSLDGWATVGKRAIDLVGSAVGLFLLAPLFLTIATLVKLHDPTGPVFYRQERLGRGGQRVGIYKFRSMLWEYSTGPDRPYKTAAEAFTAMGREDLCAEFEIAQKVAEDPRVSRFGSFLRRTSLDELPQLLNSLLGHISLVGPRPITQVELERYGPHQSSFLALKPGITGLWQVSGRSDTGYDERVKLDVYYVENWSAWLDVSILARTMVTVAARRGAY